ncbi:DNA-directed RNA polymerase, putative [Plasmodium chabaudi chabaudi]|uniref:DNA-directed RNA polymerase n=1 Tax=Plasmodium chabaudi chabaudi TaxID=31271 RepID=A0A4V0K740_PLACU|nr:DNA-directed RNA polymerase, putative [Plasmodium chabaudi chabaudi]VTZ68821.1 DNA-directed RNA polymerase, putative [Plasmodium chabaudi chabaudi]|eukprot:XP_739650.2 DNA-directed RNA polymerase, putative [Plasmodium chabaudi chabaudi]
MKTNIISRSLINKFTHLHNNNGFIFLLKKKERTANHLIHIKSNSFSNISLTKKKKANVHVLYNNEQSIKCDNKKKESTIDDQLDKHEDILSLRSSEKWNSYENEEELKNDEKADLTKLKAELLSEQNDISKNCLQNEIKTELEILVEKIKNLDEKSKNKIINYINTLDKEHTNGIEKNIILFFENLDDYLSANGLLICDVGGEEIFNYIKNVNIQMGIDKNDTTDHMNINNLFDIKWIKERKRLIYGDNIYPIIQNMQENSQNNSNSCNNIINMRRQILIERSSYKKAIEEAEEFVSNLHDLKKVTEIQGLCKIYLNWVNELEKKIINYKENIKKNHHKKNIFPDVIEEKLLAIITVKWTIQYTFNPLKKKYSNEVTTQSKHFEQEYPYQSLFTHVAIKIGEEINNELNFQLLEKNNLLYNFIKKNKSNVSFSHFQKYKMLNEIKEKLHVENKTQTIQPNIEMCANDTKTVEKKENSKNSQNTSKTSDDSNNPSNKPFELVQWNSMKKASIGGLLLKMLIDNAKIDVDINTAKNEYKNEYKYYLFLHKTAKTMGDDLYSDCKYKKELNYQEYYEHESNSLNFIIRDKWKKGNELANFLDGTSQNENEEKKKKKKKKNTHEQVATPNVSNGEMMEKKNMTCSGEIDSKEISINECNDKQTCETEKKVKQNNFCKNQKEKLKNKEIILYRSRRDKNKIEIPVFVHSYIWKNNNWYGVIHMRESCANFLLSNAINSHVPLNYLPMICKPKKWEDDQGGMLLLKNNFIRYNIKPLFNLNVCNMTRIKNIVSEIGNVGWKVNKEILHYIEYAYMNGKTIGKIPLNKNYNLPYNIDFKNNNNNNEEIKKYYLLKEEIARLNKCLISERPTFLQKLAVAKTFKENEKIYFPHNIDFRGRMYPLSPHLHHMGDDICRSLIVFSDDKEIGPNGLYWLKIHLANNFGKDKLNFKKRIEWVDNNIDNIKKLRDNPFDNLEFWGLADNPWQALSVSIDLINAINCSDPSKYKSNIPIQQDGTCNGLQHYAALGKDKDGGRAVNILPSDEPQDIYTVVLDIVINKIKNDMDNGGSKNESSTFLSKPQLANYCFKYNLLKRKVVKQTIMTICYGVTSIGAKNQVKGKIQSMIAKDTDKNTINELSKYIANYIFESISEIFKRAMIIKKWFNHLSKVTNDLNIPITWISPIGLPCEQPYRLGTRILVNTPLQSVSVTSYKNCLLHKNKQRLGFPPNFVHSLDASHLIMTAEKMLIQNNFSFAAVHDSYWAHACNVDIMNKYIRESFITLYNEPILENIYQNFQIRLGKYAEKIPPPPEQGHLDISLVRDSQYFFS